MAGLGNAGRRAALSTAWSTARLIACSVGCWVGFVLCSGAASATGIYTCVDTKGNRLTSDRPIPECSSREQRVLNSDGSVRRRVPPTLTAEEQAEQDARDRAAAAQRASEQDTARRDRNLRLRYPDEATHNKARAAALDDVSTAVKVSQKRLAALAVERKPLLAEAEFYAGKPLPSKLKRQIDANDAAVEAQRVLIQDQQNEIGRLNRNFDAELVRLRRLWRGEPGDEPGTAPASQPLSPKK